MSRNGFFLIELLVALAILSGLLLVVSSQVWQTIRWQKEAEMRLSALNSAMTMLDQTVVHKRFVATHKTLGNGIIVSIKSTDIPFCQKQTIFLKKDPNKNSLRNYKPVTTKAEWTNLNGKKETLQLLTGLLFDGCST